MRDLYTGIRRRLKQVFDRSGSERFKRNFLQALPLWVASLIVGLAAVLFARLFFWAEEGSRYVYHQWGGWLFLVTPACFILAWYLVRRMAPFASGSGIPQVMAAIQLEKPGTEKKVGRLLSLRIILVKMMSSLVMVLGGGAIGREGPTIQIAGSIFRQTNRLLPRWWPKITAGSMIMTGSAAGLAAAFNTPLGGVVFAVEELTRTHISHFKTALFTAVIIAGLAAQGILGPYLYLGYPDLGGLSGNIFLLVLVVAVLSGLAGSIMCRIIFRIIRWRNTFRSDYKMVLYVTACALVMAALAVFTDHRVMGSGKDLMQQSLFTGDKHCAWYVPGLRFIGPVFSFTTGASGGVFAPSLSAGSSIGSLFSGWFHLDNADSNMLILAGMVGFLTGVTRTPFTSAILVLEMTDRHNVIFYLMLAGMVAGIAAYLVDKRSLYDKLKQTYIAALEQPPVPGPA
ncbi:MAG: chloride channel protein [Chitinophagaceae bacterium]